MSRVIPLIGIVVGLAAVYLAVVFFAQRAIIFPVPAGAATAVPAGIETFSLAGRDGPVEAWLLRPTAGNERPAPLLLFTHGNGELIDDWAGEFAPPRAAGFAVLLVEYPGYGRSAGAPSEAAIAAAVLAAYDWARDAPDIDPRRIVAYGRSLGGGPACLLAARRPIAGLILESSFTSVPALARRSLIPGFLVRDRFDNLAALQSYRGPLLVLHGTLDDIIPVDHGRRLAGSVPEAELELLPCGHNDCPRAWARILAFLGRIAAA